MPLDSIAAAQIGYYISPSGDDKNPGTEARPFATIEKARNVVRTLNSNMAADIIINLRGGIYQLCNTVEFDGTDSGTNGFNIIYQAYPGEHPVIRGGRTVSGWTIGTNGLYQAKVKLKPPKGCKGPTPAGFRQLYVNGVRAVRARTPNYAEYHQLTSWDMVNKRIEINATEITNWPNLNKVEMIILGKGVNQANLRIGSFAVSGGSAFVVPMEPERTRIFQQGYPPKEIRPYYFENALNLLDAPGEWYLDSKAKKLFYMPRPGENFPNAEVIAPVLETLIQVRGTLNAPVYNLQFSGLTFEYSTWLTPNSEGYIGDQASIVFTEPLPVDQITSYPGHRLPAGFQVEAATNIELERNIFRHMGASAVNFYSGVRDSSFIGNVITDISGSGISVDLNLEGDPLDGRVICSRDSIINNYISQTGRDYYQSVGIMAGYTDGIVIEHNELSDMSYTGISVGWGWANVNNAARNDFIRYNDIHDVMKMESDGGGIYTLSKQPGTVVAENYIHDISRPPMAGFTSGGIFLDEGSDLITVQDNVFQTVVDMDIKLNVTGPDNVFSNNDGSSPTVIANAGIEPGYQDIIPPSP